MAVDRRFEERRTPKSALLGLTSLDEPSLAGTRMMVSLKTWAGCEQKPASPTHHVCQPARLRRVVWRNDPYWRVHGNQAVHSDTSTANGWRSVSDGVSKLSNSLGSMGRNAYKSSQFPLDCDLLYAQVHTLLSYPCLNASRQQTRTMSSLRTTTTTLQPKDQKKICA